MATAETDLDKPSEIIATRRVTRIIHPSRIIKIKLPWWNILGNDIRIIREFGDISYGISSEQMEEYVNKNGLTLRMEKQL